MHFVHKKAPCETECVSMSQKDTKKKGRRAYLDDFHKTLSGEYVYRGATYTFNGTKEQRRHLYYKLLAIGIVLAAAGLTSGSITAPGALNCFYVVIPFVTALIASLSLLWALCKLWFGGSPLREYIYTATVEQFRPRSILAAVSAGCAIVGEILFVILNGAQGMVATMLLFLLCQAVILAGSLLWLRIVKRFSWTKNEPAEAGAPPATRPQGDT